MEGMKESCERKENRNGGIKIVRGMQESGERKENPIPTIMQYSDENATSNPITRQSVVGAVNVSESHAPIPI